MPQKSPDVSRSSVASLSLVYNFRCHVDQGSGESLGARADSGETLRGSEIRDLDDAGVGVDQHVVTWKKVTRGKVT